MRYAILGAQGQLGRDLCPRLSGDVLSLPRSQVDLTQPDTVRAFLDQHQPDFVINCAAYNLVDRSESEADAAFAVNAWGVRRLAQECGKRNVVLVHFSSDYIFGLEQGRTTPYAETEAPGPVSIYGLSKLAGEYFVRALCQRHVIVRTCGLYGVWGSGGKGGNFVETMLRLGAQGKPLRVVNDQICTPSYTVDVADAVVELLASQQLGIFHITNSGCMSWFDFARTIFELAELSVDLRPVSTQNYGAAARRPAYSVLALDKILSTGLRQPRPWQQALQAYLAERKQRATV